MQALRAVVSRLWRALRKLRPMTVADRIVAFDYYFVDPPPEPTGQPNMKLDLQSLTAAMGQAAAAVASSQQFAAQLYAFGARMIVNAEQAYGAAGAGAHKRAAVLAAVSALEKSLTSNADNDAPSIMSEFTPWLETVIGAYNAVDDALSIGLPHAPTVSTLEKAANVIEQTAERVVTATEQLFKPAAPTPAQVPAANTQGV